ncbi:MAG: enoyl-CoA hydratase [Acidimicrobiales bacterium]
MADKPPGGSEPVVLYDVGGPVATITLNRPEAANAQSMALIEALDQAFDLAESDDDVRVVVLAARGKHFSSGHDLKELVGPDSAALREVRSTPEGKFHHEQAMYVEKCRRIHDFRKPTIASVQGRCIAGGLMLACMCDIIVASEDAVFSNPVLRMSGAAVELLVEPWEMGIRKAKEFLLAAEELDAQEALRVGLVNRVVPRDELESSTAELAARIALVPPITAEIVKASINNVAELMGKGASWRYHFMAHHFAHNTATSLGSLKEREQMGSMREVFAARDRGDAAGGGAPGGGASGGGASGGGASGGGASGGGG